jgi:hypothetical protein
VPIAGGTKIGARRVSAAPMASNVADPIVEPAALVVRRHDGVESSGR